MLYPVDYRPEEVLVRLTDKHVEKGSRIFTDGWAACGKLNECGYEHFTVIHSYQFTRKYMNKQTGQEIVLSHKQHGRFLGTCEETLPLHKWM